MNKLLSKILLVLTVFILTGCESGLVVNAEVYLHDEYIGEFTYITVDENVYDCIWIDENGKEFEAKTDFCSELEYIREYETDYVDGYVYGNYWNDEDLFLVSYYWSRYSK